MRTWDDNKTAINQLWSQCSWTEEERRLMHDDLGGLDQEVLYDAIRNVKRNHDTLYPQLKWMLDSYRELVASRKHASKPAKPVEKKLDITVFEDEDKQMTGDFLKLIDMSSPSDFSDIEHRVLHIALPKMHAVSAIRVLNYARCRLLGEQMQLSRVTSAGELVPLSVGGAVK